MQVRRSAYQLSLLFEKVPLALIPHRVLVSLLFILLTMAIVFGMMTRFQLDMALESWFNDSDPAKISLDEFRQVFGSDDGVYLVYQAQDKNVFSSESITTLLKLHQELKAASLDLDLEKKQPKNQLSRIQRVDSIVNSRYQIADGDTLISRPLIGETLLSPPTPEHLIELRKIAHAQAHFPLAYFSLDDRFGGIRLKTDFGMIPVELQEAFQFDEISDTNFSDSLTDDLILGDLTGEENTFPLIEYKDTEMQEYLDFMRDLKAVTSKPEYQNFKFYFAGNAPMMEFAMESMAQATGLMMLMLVVVIILLWFLFRSWSAVIWPVILITSSAIWVVGLGSWLNMEFSNMVSLTFMLILAVGIADCVHVLSAYIHSATLGADHESALKTAYRKTGVPILLTTITTMIGMLSLTFSDIPQISVFGYTSAAGVGIAFILTLFLLPVLLDFWHPKIKARATEQVVTEQVETKMHWLQSFLDKIPKFIGRFKTPIILLYGSIFIIFLGFTSQIKVDSNFVELTREGSEIRETAETIDEHMMGGNNMEIMMDFGRRDSVKDVKVLKAVDQLQQRLIKDYPEFVVKTFSIADWVKDTHQIMQEGNEEFYRIPDDSRLAAQLLYLFNNSNPEDRRQLVDDDYAKTHLSVQLKNAGSYEYRALFDQVNLDIAEIFDPLKTEYPEMNVNVTGSLALMMMLIDHMSWAQLKSFSIALGIISLIMILVLGSVQGGIMAMGPNLLPAIFTFGLMGALGIPLDTDTLVIAPVIIGIVVDDTIHFLAHYREAWFKTEDVDAALKSTIQEVGQAVTFTTLILGAGFFMLSFSSYLGLAKTGIFGSLAIFVALSCDLLLLPAMIKWLKPDLGLKKMKKMLAEQNREREGEVHV